nr:antithrombin 1 B chain [Deinagkistrodon acutus]
MGRFIFVSFGLLVVFLSLRGTGAGFCCPLRWSSYEGHCYLVVKEKKTWDDAEKFCTEQRKGGHLVSVHSREEADFLVHLAYPILDLSLIWMGLSNMWNDCKREWSDGTKLDFKSWAKTSDCLIGKTDGDNQWLNMDCSKKHYFVCKFKL